MIEYIGVLLLLIVMSVSVVYCWDKTNTTAYKSRNVTMVWIPNNEGLFAIFLALRVMFYQMAELGPSNRVLVIPPRHRKKILIIMWGNKIMVFMLYDSPSVVHIVLGYVITNEWCEHSLNSAYEGPMVTL
jgi:hypothetical protein